MELTECKRTQDNFRKKVGLEILKTYSMLCNERPLIFRMKILVLRCHTLHEYIRYINCKFFVIRIMLFLNLVLLCLQSLTQICRAFPSQESEI